MKSAYLNAKLKETIYMKPLRGVLKKGQEGKVLKLKKGLYGLKQAGRQYFTVPHIVHWTPVDSAERSVDNDRTFAQFCINFNYYYLILPFKYLIHSFIYIYTTFLFNQPYHH